MLHKISVLGILIFSMGCMKIQKKGEQKKEEAPVSLPSPSVKEQMQSNKVVLDYELSEGSESIRFQLPDGWPQLLVVEKNKGAEKIFSREVYNVSGEWRDSLDGKSKFGYRFFAKISDQLILLDELEVLPILDLTLNQDYRLDEIYQIGDKVRKIQLRHLYLKQKAKFFIGDFSGRIEIEDLISDDGAIQTFPTGQRAVGKDGRSVGSFEIQASTARGKLYLNLVAESGGHGSVGENPDEKLTGSAGENGTPAQFSQRPGDLCAGTNGFCLSSVVFDCSQSPLDGENGGRGLDGYPGHAGFNGGSVESVKLIVPAELSVQINKVVGAKGEGGAGGAGGPGGPGGKGGDGGEKDFLKFLKLNPEDAANRTHLNLLGKTCNAAEHGSKGPQGGTGSKGPDGLAGNIF